MMLEARSAHANGENGENGECRDRESVLKEAEEWAAWSAEMQTLLRGVGALRAAAAQLEADLRDLRRELVAHLSELGLTLPAHTSRRDHLRHLHTSSQSLSPRPARRAAANRL